MNLLIHITASTELACYEAMALALTMATFDHNVQIWLHNDCFAMLCDANSRMAGMIKSLPLYDIPPVWLNRLDFTHCVKWLDEEMVKQMSVMPENITPDKMSTTHFMEKFDKVLVF